jgi:hypothetical protein
VISGLDKGYNMTTNALGPEASEILMVSPVPVLPIGGAFGVRVLLGRSIVGGLQHDIRHCR